MFVVHARVDHGHNDVVRAAGIDAVRIQVIPRLPGLRVVMIPLLVIGWIRCRVRQVLDHVGDLVVQIPLDVRFHTFDVGNFRKLRYGAVHINIAGQLQAVPAGKLTGSTIRTRCALPTRRRGFH